MDTSFSGVVDVSPPWDINIFKLPDIPSVNKEKETPSHEDPVSQGSSLTNVILQPAKRAAVMPKKTEYSKRHDDKILKFAVKYNHMSPTSIAI